MPVTALAESANARRIEQLFPQWGRVLETSHIIAAVRNPAALAAAAESPTETVYLLFGNTLNIGEMLKSMREHGKLPLVNLDLLHGFSRDSVNAEYLARAGAAGVVSTHSEVLRAAHKWGLITVQRTFALDSAAVDAGLSAPRGDHGFRLLVCGSLDAGAAYASGISQPDASASIHWRGGSRYAARPVFRK